MTETKKNDPFDFTNQIDKASWDMLKDHHDRGAVFLVDHKLDIVNVATAIAKDELSQVKLWLDANQLSQVSEEQIKEWESTPSKKVVNFLIVQPYVIIQVIEQDLQ